MPQGATPSLALSSILPVTDFEATQGTERLQTRPALPYHCLASLPAEALSGWAVLPTTLRRYTHAPTVPPSVATATP